MNIPNFTNDDILYIYKVQHFNGFAPCFDNNIFSLACCKGNKKNGGMRVSICKRFDDAKTNRNVWILGVAGSKIKNGNDSDIKYEQGDMVYLAKISSKDQLKTWNEYYNWKEYYNKYKEKRRDAIYKLEGEKIIWKKNSFKDHEPKDEKDRTCLETDCSACINGKSEKDIYNDLKQIVVSEDFWIFEEGAKLPKDLNVNRNYSCNETGESKRTEQLFYELSKKNIQVEKKNPFKDKDTSKGNACHLRSKKKEIADEH